MTKVKLALFAAVPMIFAGLAMAQTPPPATGGMPMMGHHRPDPVAMHKDMCGNEQAMKAARLAFVEAKLELTDPQKPLFNKWRQAVLDSAAKEKAGCLAAAPKSDTPPTIVERETHAEAMLAAKLQALQSTHASLQAFYESLNPTQREVLDRGRHGHGMRHGMGHGGWEGNEDAHGGMPHPQ